MVKSAFKYKASVSFGSASVPADFPAVFLHISHWYLSWNTIDKSTSQESVEKGNQLHQYNKTGSLFTCIWKACASSLPRLSGLGTKANCWLALNESASSSLPGSEPVIDNTLDLHKFVSESNFSQKWKNCFQFFNERLSFKNLNFCNFSHLKKR